MPMYVDLAGLPMDVVVKVMDIINEAERAKAKAGGIPVVEPAGFVRLPSAGRFAHLGWSFPPEWFEEVRQEIADGFERKWAEYGPCHDESVTRAVAVGQV